MADYWKSQAKKFCDFCKCWIADNKPSVGFHESGKRHKENVAKRLSEISKKSAKNHQESLQVDQEMKKMEEEAMKAYLKDLQENPDYTSKVLIEAAERKTRDLEELVKKQKEDENNSIEPEPEKSETDTATLTKVWHEAKSNEGHTYYWNVNTSESKWEPPEEGYVSIEEQEKEAKLQEEMKRRKKEEKAKRKQEKMDAKESTKKKKKKDQHPSEDSCMVVGPAPKPDPYGAWTVVQPKVEEPIDLQLPQQEFFAIKVPELREPQQVKFKEKTIESLDKDPLLESAVKQEPVESSGAFKKRKFNRGNLRQKLDTD